MKKIAKKKANNKKKILLFSILTIGTLLVLLVLIFAFKEEKITCNIKEEKDNLTQNNKVIFYFKTDKIKEINVTRKISVNKQNHIYNYLDVFEASLKDVYKEQDIEYKITNKNNILVVNTVYNKQQIYTLDSVILSLQNESVNVSVIGQDINNEYLTFDLSKKHNKNEVIKKLENKGYTCK